MTSRTTPPRVRGARTLLILLLLFLAAWVPRGLALDAFVTPDEPTWLYRSANFYQAIGRGDFAGTFQREHPGVTVTWMGALGFLQLLPNYAEEAPGQLGEGQLEAWLRAHSTVEPLQLLVAGRRWIVLWIALLIVAAFFPLRRLFGAQIAVLAVLMLAWDPFLIALSRQLHLDGLLASLTLLALLTFLAWLHGGRQLRYLVISALATALAVLTKTPALVMLPAAGLLLLVEWVRCVRAGDGKAFRLWLAFGAWLALAALAVVGLWPALWVEPLHVLSSIVAGMRVHAAGHDSLNFFLGRATDDPGPLFYPVAYLFRATPAVLVGLAAAALFGWRRRWPLDAPARRRSALGLVTFALICALFMTFGAKKFDRYISPVFAALDIVAALGLAGLANMILVRWRQPRSRAAPDQGGRISDAQRALGFGVALTAVLLLHGLFAAVHFPYYFTYYNPLAGGSRIAPRVLLVGWGEGLDAAAAWLKQQPDAARMRVVSWYADGPLSYFLQPGQKALSFYFTSHLLDADYAVLYANQWQRGLPSPELVDYFLAQEPAHVVRSGGLELARIYDVRNQPPPEFVGINTSSAADYGERMRLAAYRLAQPSVSAGDRVPVTLYLKKLAEVDAAYNVLLRLVAPDGREVWRDEGWPAGAPTVDWPADEIRYDDHEIVIPGGAAPGRYRLLLSFYDSRTAELLPAGGGGASHEVASLDVKAPETGDQASASAPGGDGQVEESVVAPRLRSVDVRARWDAVQLIILQHARQMVPGQTLRVELAAQGQVDGSRNISARLLDPSGVVRAQMDDKLWPQMRLDLELPADAEPGSYTLAVVLYDPETLGPFPDTEGNFITMLSEVEVLGASAP